MTFQENKFNLFHTKKLTAPLAFVAVALVMLPRTLLRSFFIFFVIFLAAGRTMTAEQPRQASASVDFQTRFDYAQQLASEGKFRESELEFERLLKSNPKEFMIYDAYARLLSYRGIYRRVIKVYRIWMEKYAGIDAEYDERAREGIEESGKKQAFLKVANNLPDWEKATTFWSSGFYIKTNLSPDLANTISNQVKELLGKEQKELERIMPFPIEQRQYPRIILTGRYEDYRNYLIDNHIDPLDVPTAFYVPQSQTIFVFYDGAFNPFNLAHTLTLHLMHNFIRNPSEFLDQGMAYYMGFKFAKANARSILRNDLETLNWLYDQNEWGDFSDIFARGGKHALNKTRYMFYLKSWLAVSFFIQAEDAFLKESFRKYLEYERVNKENSFKSPYHFFKKHLTREQYQLLSDKWVDFCLKLSYETI